MPSPFRPHVLVMRDVVMVRTFTYDPTFNQVTSSTDPLGNLTTFEYDATDGGLTWTPVPVKAP